MDGCAISFDVPSAAGLTSARVELAVLCTATAVRSLPTSGQGKMAKSGGIDLSSLSVQDLAMLRESLEKDLER